MSLKALVGIAGDVLNVPGADIAISAAIDLAQAVQNVKIYRTQCQGLSDRCIRLLLAFREKCKGLEGTQVMAAADEVTCIIERAHKKAANWAAMSRVKSFVNQGDIKSGLEQLYREIDLCAQQFNIASSAELHRGQHELQLIHERDVTENREILQSILRSVDGLRDVLNAGEPNAVQNIMQTIQEELQLQTAQPDQQRDLQQGLYAIHRQTQFLPPMIDLTGQVEIVSKHAVAFGAYNDVYTGLWLGEEKVALKFARAINHTAKARKRFHKEVEIWRDLQHPHISRLYGIVYFDDHIYSVSPWMENGSAFDFINSREDVINRLAILRDVASGMEYLHMRNVVHGDLRAANILIGDDGKACVSDFGLSKVIEQVAPDMSSSTHGDSPIRWQARELIKPEDYGGEVAVSPTTDIWSYGMLCLEIMTGKKPYHYRPRDANVIADLVERRLPERPTDEVVVARGLDDQLWSWLLRCWNWEPQERPPMATLKRILRSLSSGVLLSTPILNNSLSESPRLMSDELSPTAERIPHLRENASLQSSGSEPIVTSDPSLISRQALLALPPTSPKASAFDDSSKYYRSQTVPVQLPSLVSKHISPVSPRPGQNAYSSSSSLGPTPDTGGSLGLIIDQTSYASSQHQPSLGSGETVRSAHTHNSLSYEARDDQLHTSIWQGFSPPGRPSLVESLDPRSSPLVVNVEGSDGDVSAASSPFSGPIDQSLRKLSISEYACTPRSAGLLYTPRSALNEDRNEGEHSGESSSSVISSSIDSSPHHGRTSSLSDSLPPRSSLSDFSDLDCSSNSIKYNRNGSVKAGSLFGLVNRLLKDTEGGYTRDQEFREVFLTTHRLFASTRDILRFLMRQFVLANSDQSMHARDRAGTRFMTLNILNQLLKGHYAKAIERAVLLDLHAFLQEITEPVLLLKTARDLTDLVEDLLAASAAPRVTSPTLSRSETKKSIRTSDISPLDLALALSELEGAKYKAITATDCISYLLCKDGPSGAAEANLVAEARATNNKIVNWVKKSVIKSDRMENRGDTLRFFVNTAAECRKLHNYSSMSALLAGIDSQTVTRLKLTRGCLDKQMREVQKQLSALLEISHNHRAYREALPDPKKAACLPWLAVHLKDLQTVYERLSRRIVIGDESLINFEKFTAVHDSILTVLSFQVPVNAHIRGDREQKLGTLLYLQGQLAATQLGQVAEDKMEARSLELQKQEDRDYEHRVTELAAVGFRTARGRS